MRSLSIVTGASPGRFTEDTKAECNGQQQTIWVEAVEWEVMVDR